MDVRWPFGFGLSYTTFKYSDLLIEDEKVSVTVTNTGPEAGSEVVLMFVSPMGSRIHRPERELKGFKKVYLERGESARVSFKLENRTFAVWQDGWKVPSGLYSISAGPLSDTINVTGDDISSSSHGNWYHTLEGIPSIEELEAEAGRKYVSHRPKRGEYTMNNSIEEMKDSCFAMKMLYKKIPSYVSKRTGVSYSPDDPEYRMMLNSTIYAPLRTVQIFSGMRDGVFLGLLKMANGHFLSGLLRMLKS